MICFEVTINVTSKQIIKKEMMEPNVLKLSQRLLIQRTLNVDVHNNSPIHIPIHLKPFGYKNGHYDPKILKFHYMKSPIFGAFLDANRQCQVVYLLRKSHKNFLQLLAVCHFWQKNLICKGANRYLKLLKFGF